MNIPCESRDCCGSIIALHLRLLNEKDMMIQEVKKEPESYENIISEKITTMKLEKNIQLCSNVLHRTLSYHEVKYASDLVYNFLKEKKYPSVCCYGSSSWNMVGHNLFYDSEGVLYGFYNSGENITAFYVDKSFIEDMFNENDERRYEICI